MQEPSQNDKESIVSDTTKDYANGPTLRPTA